MALKHIKRHKRSLADGSEAILQMVKALAQPGSTDGEGSNMLANKRLSKTLVSLYYFGDTTIYVVCYMPICIFILQGGGMIMYGTFLWLLKMMSKQALYCIIS